MSDTVCRDCGRTIDLSHIPPTCMPPAERIQCSRCFVVWLKAQGLWAPDGRRGDVARKPAA